MSTRVQVNGVVEMLRSATISDLLASKEIPEDGRGVAVAVNGSVIRRAEWANTPLSSGDKIEIVHARQGG